MTIVNIKPRQFINIIKDGDVYVVKTAGEETIFDDACHASNYAHRLKFFDSSIKVIIDDETKYDIIH